MPTRQDGVENRDKVCCSDEQVARTKGDYKFSTAKDPLFNSTGFCMVEDHCRQEHRCDCPCTDRNLSMLEQRLKRAVQKAYLDYSRRGKKKCSLNHTQGLVYTQCMLAKKEDVRDILD